MKKARNVFFLITAMAVAGLLAPEVWSYEAGEVASGGTINGKVVFNGSVPMRKIIPTKDTEVCGGIQEVPLIKVGPDKGVQEVVVHLQGVDKGKAWMKAEPAVPILDNKKCSFEPHVQVVAEDAAIEIHNSDPVLHNTHGFLDDKTVFNVALPIQGMKINKSLKKPGLVRVDCDAHGWMRGWVYVADNPYYDITDEKGNFSITEIPPGTYTLKTWQEEKGVMEQEVKVEAGKTVSLNIELK
jgi:hypothetical protein